MPDNYPVPSNHLQVFSIPLENIGISPISNGFLHVKPRKSRNLALLMGEYLHCAEDIEAALPWRGQRRKELIPPGTAPFTGVTALPPSHTPALFQFRFQMTLISGSI